MKRRLTGVLLGAMLMSTMLIGMVLAGGLYLSAADGDVLQIPKVVEARSSFSITTRAAGKTYAATNTTVATRGRSSHVCSIRAHRGSGAACNC